MPVRGAYFENMKIREHEFSAIPCVYDEKVYYWIRSFVLPSFSIFFNFCDSYSSALRVTETPWFPATHFCLLRRLKDSKGITSVGVQVPFGITVFSKSLPRSGIAGYGSSSFRCSLLFSTVAAPVCISTHQHPFSPRLLQHLLFVYVFDHGSTAETNTTF